MLRADDIGKTASSQFFGGLASGTGLLEVLTMDLALEFFFEGQIKADLLELVKGGLHLFREQLIWDDLIRKIEISVISHTHPMVPTLGLFHLLRHGKVMLLGAVNMNLPFAGILGAMLVRIFEMADLASMIVLLIVSRALEGYRGIVGDHFYIVMHQSTVNVDEFLLSYFLHSALGPLANQAFQSLGGLSPASIA